MNKIKSTIRNTFCELSIFEWCLWIFSLIIITVTTFLTRPFNYLSYVVSIFGISSLIFVSKGNILGQYLGIIFAVLYAIQSYFCQYYGEMITFLCMMLPIEICACISWIKNPYSKTQVKINKVSKKEYIFMFLSAIPIFIGFYFLLRFFNTSNLIPSTLSIVTSAFAAYLMFRRSEYYALAYMSNDIVLIILWTLATIQNINYLTMSVCAFIYFINDIYGFCSWKVMRKKQRQ